MKYLRKYTNLAGYDSDNKESLLVSLISDNSTVMYNGSPQSIYVPEHNILSPHIDAYWNNVHYSNTDDSTQISLYQIQDVEDDYYVPFVLKFNGNRNGVLVVSDLNNIINSYSLNNQSEISLYNLLPNHRYFYKINPESLSTNSADINPSINDKSFILKGSRMYYTLDDAYNVRDFGGMIGAGGKRIKYGKIIRGSALSASDRIILSTAIAGYKDILIYDFRKPSEMKSTDAEYFKNYPLENSYRNLVQKNPTIIEAIDEILSHPYGVVIYIQCVWGAHRTGAISTVLQGLLGVSFSEMAKDFELTSFDKNYLNSLNLIFNENDHHQRDFFTYIKENYNGSVVDYVKSLGISSEKIENFRELMLEDYSNNSSAISISESRLLPNCIISEEDGLYQKKNNEIYPVSHPDLSTQPSILPQRFGLFNIKEVLIKTMLVPISFHAACHTFIINGPPMEYNSPIDLNPANSISSRYLIYTSSGKLAMVTLYTGDISVMSVVTPSDWYYCLGYIFGYLSDYNIIYPLYIDYPYFKYFIAVNNHDYSYYKYFTARLSSSLELSFVEITLDELIAAGYKNYTLSLDPEVPSSAIIISATSFNSNACVPAICKKENDKWTITNNENIEPDFTLVQYYEEDESYYYSPSNVIATYTGSNGIISGLSVENVWGDPNITFNEGDIIGVVYIDNASPNNLIVTNNGSSVGASFGDSTILINRSNYLSSYSNCPYDITVELYAL